jgi:hypothetical protein
MLLVIVNTHIIIIIIIIIIFWGDVMRHVGVWPRDSFFFKSDEHTLKLLTFVIVINNDLRIVLCV